MFIKLCAIGRLGRDAELKYTQEGKAVVNVSMACDVGWGDKKKTQWVDLTLWEERGEKLAPHLTKGKVVYVEGTPSTRAWTDRNTGESRSALQITVRELTFCGGERKDNQQQQGHDPEFDTPSAPRTVVPLPVAQPMPSYPQPGSPITDEDIPF